ncbi:MAG: NAD(P)H-hydrate epimerase [Candidatus Omnitrophica bacterium]|nr:NAD(P)H-hydrate epimerase [Candidatus Omnitrophota bacterium]MDD5670256.1 NAD(P)H-hydrate epimerase [Candidatus Omnitrophota bacterium]
MRGVTAAVMQALDRKAIEEYGIPGLLLMENAGRGIAEFIFDLSRRCRVTVFAGKGNNGGDGFVVARHLANRGCQVLILLFGDAAKLKDDPAVNYAIAVRMKIPVVAVGEAVTKEELIAYVERSDVIVDALFGVGLHAPPAGNYRQAVEAINQAAKTVVAVDVPSGIHADTGEVLGCAVRATHTATLGLPKKGLFEGRGPEYAGKIAVIHIGIPNEELEKALNS